MSWTDERIDRLMTMWEGGATASQIAEELGGVSRNAVIGKAHRLGLKARPSPVKLSEKPAERDDVVALPAVGPKRLKPAVETEVAALAEPIAPITDIGPSSEEIAREPEVDIDAELEDEAEDEDGDGDENGGDAAEDVAAGVPRPPQPRIVSVGPGGFLRQGPGDQQAPIPPAPPRRLVPAKPSAEIADKTSLLDLNERICRWPMGHPGEPDFHFCGDKVNPGFPYCVTHCGRAYQAQLPRGARRPPPPLPFGGPRVR